MNGPTPLLLRFDAFELDEADARLRREGTPVSLAPKAFAVLCTLARQPGTLVTKNDLLDAVWGHQHVSESVLKTVISELRAALNDDAKQPRYIETASRRGYRFIGRAGVPTAAPGRAPVSFVGREQALARLRAAWRKAQNGERQLVWIAGEAGIGKTRLIETFMREIDPLCATCGQCVEHFGDGEPYLPLLEAIKELCRREPQLVEIMRTTAPTWLLQMPWLLSESLREQLYREVAGAHQDRMVREMREMMDRYTADRPLAFVLEDLHWSDAGTLRMMEHFARRPRQVKLLWIASFRLTQVIAQDHPLRALRQELRLHNLCEEILLEPFSESEVAAYMADRAPQTPFPESFIRRLHAHTEGLPLFVANVTDTLLAGTDSRSWLAEDSGTPLPVPDSLAGVIENQINALPPEEQQMLEAASIFGAEFRAGAVAKLLGVDAQAVSSACDSLARRKIWLRHIEIVELPDGELDSRYGFLHALYQHVFYERVPPARCVQLHRLAATWLESLRESGQAAPPAELASHFDRGRQPLAALRCYAEASEIAIAHFAPLEAMNLTATAMKLFGRCPAGPERMEAELSIMHKRGLASGQLHGIGALQTTTAFERARELCDALPESAERAIFLNGLGLMCYVLGDYAQASATAERITSLGVRFGAPVPPMCGHLLRGMVHAIQGEHELARDRFRAGIALCEQMGNRIPFTRFVVDPFVSMRANLAVPLVYLGLPRQAREQQELAYARACELGQPTAQMFSLWVGGMIESRLGERDKVAVHARALASVVERAMLAQGEGPARWLQGWVLAHSGSPLAGFELIRAGYESHARLGMYAGNAETLCHAAEAMLLAGDLVLAERQIEEATELVHRFRETSELPSVRLLHARIALARGQRREARSFMEDALADARAARSPFFELKTLLALCEQPDVRPDELGALARVYAAVPEMHGSPLAQRAARLLTR